MCKEFIIDEKYEQVIVNPEGSIEISGLSLEDASKIEKDANDANMPCDSELMAGSNSRVAVINVKYDCVILTKDNMAITLNSEDYQVESIIINIK